MDEQPGQVTPEVPAEPEEDIHETLREMRDEIRSIRLDLDHAISQAEGTDGQFPQEQQQSAPNPVPQNTPITTPQAAPNKPDPYMTERMPTRRHGLFKRVRE